MSQKGRAIKTTSGWWLPGAGVIGRKWEVTANGCRVALGGDENV